MGSGTVYFNRAETSVNVAGWASTALATKDRCLKIKYGLTWSWRGASPGITPGHYKGTYCR